MGAERSGAREVDAAEERRLLCQALLDNYAAVIDELNRAKPSAAKGKYFVSITLTSTMGPGVHVDTSLVRAADILGEGAPDEGGSDSPAADAPADAEPVEA